jgi:4-hydroxy-3-polyprenylbenzoate decarboxylase
MNELKDNIKHIIIGITGASGCLYGYYILKNLAEIKNIKTHLIVSKTAKLNIEIETSFNLSDYIDLSDFYYENDDFLAPIASGSFKTNGMIISPCSVKTMSSINIGYTETLISRCADVCLKERRRLVLMFRETPLHEGHIKTMLDITKIGAIVMPPVPSFYTKPKTIEDITKQTAGRAVELLGVDTDIKRWGE